MANVGKNIRRLRNEKRMTQDELAEKLFVNRQTISNYETGKSNPNIDMLLKIAEIFQTDVTVLIFGTSDMSERKKDIRCLIPAVIALAVLVLLYRYLDSWKQVLVKEYYDVGLGFFMYLILIPTLCLLTGWVFMQLMKLFMRARRLSGKGSAALFYVFLVLMLLYFLSVIPLCVETGIISLGNIFPCAKSLSQYPADGETYFSFPSALHLWSSDVSYRVFDCPQPLFCCIWLLGGAVLWNGPGRRLSFPFPPHPRRKDENSQGT